MVENKVMAKKSVWGQVMDGLGIINGGCWKRVVNYLLFSNFVDISSIPRSGFRYGDAGKLLVRKIGAVLCWSGFAFSGYFFSCIDYIYSPENVSKTEFKGVFQIFY